MGPGARAPRRPWAGRRVVLGVSGGVAAYKAVQLARDLTLLGAAVDVVLTRAAGEFVRPLSFEAVTGRRAWTDLFEPGEASLHLRLAREADAVVVAPATAGLLARAAAGLADDLLTTLLLATEAPVVLCPAMNDRMWGHPATRENVERLRGRPGVRIAGPGTGPLGYGEGEGPGRMLEPHEIVEHVGRALGEGAPWLGRTVLVTAGPTREPLDPVRFLSNRSSGLMGHEVARAAWRRGARVRLVTGPTALEAPVGVERTVVETAAEMERAVSRELPEADVLVMAAAVADYRPAEVRPEKVKRGERGEEWEVRLVANPDILGGARERRRPGAVVVGFALETGDPVEGARRKLEAKGLDLVVANDPGEEGAGFDVPTNRVRIVSREGEVEELPLLPKEEVAERLLDRIEPLLGGRG